METTEITVWMCYQCQGNCSPIAMVGGLGFCSRHCLDTFAQRPGAETTIARFGISVTTLSA